MTNTFKAKQSKLRFGANKTADIAILETQLMIARHYTRSTREEEERMRKFIDLNDAMDGLEGLIAGKIRLAEMTDWIKYHNFVKNNLKDPVLVYSNLPRFCHLVSMRYKLYNIVLQSLGYYTTDIIRNELFDSLGYSERGQESFD